MVVVGLLWTTSLLLSVKLSLAGGVRKSGPYNLIVEKLTSCDDQGTGKIVFGTRITKTSDGKYMYNSPVYLGHPIDEDSMLKVELQVFSNGGYRPRFMQYTFKGCEEQWKYFEEFYKSLMQSMGNAVDKCPLPAGNYTTKEFEVNVHQVKNIPVMMYNKYKVVVTFFQKMTKVMMYKQYKAVVIIFHKMTEVGCLNIYSDVVPKE